MLVKKEVENQNKQNRAMKYRAYPSEAQIIFFHKTFGCVRKVWNLMLHDRSAAYKNEKKTIKPTPALYKETYPFLKEIDSLALTNTQLHLERAYNAFFQKKAKFPKFKSKKGSHKSYTTNNQNGTIRFEGDGIKLPKIKQPVKIQIHRHPQEDWVIKSATISQESDGNYYISVLFEYHKPFVGKTEIQTHVGLDYKSDGLYVASDGTCADMPHFYRKSQRRLAKLQKQLAKKESKSNNYYKQIKRVNKLHKHIANQRKDFLQKKSAEITNQYDLISVEDLNLRAIANKKMGLGKATNDNGYGMFLRMVEYKQKEKGHYFVKIDKWFPSSQTCSCCGYKNPATKDLSVRTVTCPNCGITYDRDDNASKNIDKEGLSTFLRNKKQAV